MELEASERMKEWMMSKNGRILDLNGVYFVVRYARIAQRSGVVFVINASRKQTARGVLVAEWLTS
jgi:hypothetical protein